MTLSKRLKAMGNPKYQTDGDPRTSGPGFGVTVHPDSLDIPRRWRTQRLVFVNSMSDLFHARVPASFVVEVFKVMAETPQHSYQILTKRPARLARMADRLSWPSNVWMGVSIESQDTAGRCDILREIPAAVRFVSAEPLLGPLELDLEGIDWVITGGESGPGHRPVRAEWVRSLRGQCQRTGTAFFFKQWGGIRPKTGGRTLDGQIWSELPFPVYGRAKVVKGT